MLWVRLLPRPVEGKRPRPEELTLRTGQAALMTLHAAFTLESCPWGLGSSEYARPGYRLQGWQQ